VAAAASAAVLDGTYGQLAEEPTTEQDADAVEMREVATAA
jgi:hypothetical protein